MKYIYGPVHSRRLGLSLGLSLTPHKTCNFDCVYCQLGPTDTLSYQIKEYIPVSEIFDELQLWGKANPEQLKELKFITFSGCGEPTLNAGIGRLIGLIKQSFTVPVCVITNASEVSSPEARKQLLGAELIVPSLDAVDAGMFAAVNRPHASVKLTDIIEGLVSLRREFRGKIWLEIMVVKGINDSLAHARELKDVVDRINPDRIQLNSPVRSTAEKDILPADEKRLQKIKEILGDKAEIV
jgi:wyosine [tRNA(Phe)-imidazoG37] synthetase (radical SAM superfamily)